MPYKIIFHDYGSNEPLDQVTVKNDRELKSKLHKMINEADLQDGSSFVIFQVSKEEVETDEVFDNIVRELGR